MDYTYVIHETQIRALVFDSIFPALRKSLNWNIQDCSWVSLTCLLLAAGNRLCARNQGNAPAPITQVPPLSPAARAGNVSSFFSPFSTTQAAGQSSSSFSAEPSPGFKFATLPASWGSRAVKSCLISLCCHCHMIAPCQHRLPCSLGTAPPSQDLSSTWRYYEQNYTHAALVMYLDFL